MKADKDIEKLLRETTAANPVVSAAPEPGSPEEPSEQQELRRDLHVLTRALHESGPLLLADRDSKNRGQETDTPSDADIDSMIAAVRAVRPGIVDPTAPPGWNRWRVVRVLALAASVCIGLFLVQWHAGTLRQADSTQADADTGPDIYADMVASVDTSGRDGASMGVFRGADSPSIPDYLWGDEDEAVAVLFDRGLGVQVVRAGEALPAQSVMPLVPGARVLVPPGNGTGAAGNAPACLLVYADSVHLLNHAPVAPLDGGISSPISFVVGRTAPEPEEGTSLYRSEMAPLSKPLLPVGHWFAFLNGPDQKGEPPETTDSLASLTILAPRGSTWSLTPRIQTNGQEGKVYEVRLLDSSGAPRRSWTPLQSWSGSWDSDALGTLSRGASYVLEARERGSPAVPATSVPFTMLSDKQARRLNALLNESRRVGYGIPTMTRYLYAVRLAQAECYAEARLQGSIALAAAKRSEGDGSTLFLALIAAMYDKLGMPDSAARCREAIPRAVP